MKRVTGIGGIFFKSKDPKALQAWYREHLGMELTEWGGMTFESAGAGETTVWSTFEESSDYFAPSTAPFMVNYRVEDLHAVLAALREEGCNVVDKVDESEFGKFGWVIDPDGNKLELWQPPSA